MDQEATGRYEMCTNEYILTKGGHKMVGPDLSVACYESKVTLGKRFSLTTVKLLFLKMKSWEEAQ